MAELIPVAVSLPFCFVGRGNSMYTPHMGDVLTFGMDLLGIMELESTWIGKITNGSNPREEPLLEPDKPRHVSNAGSME